MVVRACEMDIGKIKFTILIICYVWYYNKFIPNIILFNSKSAIKLHRKLGYSNSNLIYIPNGFDVNKFKPDLIKRNMFRKEIISKMNWLLEWLQDMILLK